MHKRGLCRHAVSVSLSLSVCVCPSVRHVRELSLVPKRIKISSKFFSPSGSQAILVFPRQTGWRYSDGNPPNGSVECRRGRQKNAILNEYLASLHTGVRCCRPHESRSVKNKAAAASVEHTASSVVRTRRRRSVCDGLDAGEEVKPPWTQPPWS